MPCVLVAHFVHPTLAIGGAVEEPDQVSLLRSELLASKIN
jgi:hypothetical protein